MTQEDKLLLFSDLTTRLRYGVIVHYECKWDTNISGDGSIRNIYIDDCLESDFAGIEIGIVETGLGYIKPYLRPMLSMTEKEKDEFQEILGKAIMSDTPVASYQGVDWLNAHHFDYRGLIERKLAIDVTKDSNPYEQSK